MKFYMEKNLIDSSVWIALYLPYDALHKKALQFFQKNKITIVLPYCVIEEVVSVLTYKHSRAQARRFLEALRTSKDIEYIEPQVQIEIDFFLSHNHKISFTDSTLLCLAQQKNIELITFDKQLLKLLG